MVAKRGDFLLSSSLCYLLAKIHMVAKPKLSIASIILGYLLAKIHMVAKLSPHPHRAIPRYLLAKIHMVAKRSTTKTCLSELLSSSKSPYGSKTFNADIIV